MRRQPAGRMSDTADECLKRDDDKRAPLTRTGRRQWADHPRVNGFCLALREAVTPPANPFDVSGPYATTMRLSLAFRPGIFRINLTETSGREELWGGKTPRERRSAMLRTCSNSSGSCSLPCRPWRIHASNRCSERS